MNPQQSRGICNIDVFLHENPTGQCLLDRICLSNECSRRDKICCEECYDEFHPSHPERVYSYIFGYKALKNSMYERRMNLEKTLDQLNATFQEAKRKREKLKEKILKQFSEIEANCAMQFHADTARLKQHYQDFYRHQDMEQLKSIVESKQNPTDLSEEKKSHLTNDIFSSFTFEYHPSLSMKLRNEGTYQKEQQAHLNVMIQEIEQLHNQLCKVVKQCDKVRISTFAQRMIDYYNCQSYHDVITSINTQVNQILILNRLFMVVSHQHEASNPNRDEKITVLSLLDSFKPVTFAQFPHVKLLDIKHNSAFIAQSRASFTKLKIVGRQLVQLKSVHLDEYIAQAEFIPEFNLLLVCTKDTFSDIHHKINLYDANAFQLVKRYSILIGSQRFLVACSPLLNIFAIADKRNLSFYNIMDGSFIRYLMIGINLNDDIVEIQFRKKPGYSVGEVLLVSNMQGMVTQIEFRESKLVKKILVPSSKNNDIFFTFVEEISLLMQPRILVIQAKKNRTMLVDLPVGSKKQKEEEEMEKKSRTKSKKEIHMDSEYSTHTCVSECTDSSKFTAFIGTITGQIHIIEYIK